MCHINDVERSEADRLGEPFCHQCMHDLNLSSLLKDAYVRTHVGAAGRHDR